jgi:5-methylthioadenosine/S-adenosylhomocysteine deaminase
VLFKNITAMNADFIPEAGKFVGIKGDRIDYIGDRMPDEDFGEHYDGKDRLLMPAFFNAHSHLPMTLLRGYGENMALQDWLNTRIFPFENRLTGEDIYQGTLLGLAEMIRFGIVSTTDMYYHGEEMCRAILESGAKCNLSVGTVCFDDSDYRTLPSYRAAKSLFENYQDANGQSLKIDLSIHGEYTSTPKVVSQLADYAEESGMRVQVHVSESKEEHEGCKTRRCGMTPVQYLADLGLLGKKTTAAHCVWLEGEDSAILAEKGVSVATCPKSNLKLASGLCDVPGLMSKGINVAIGTDGSASNNNLNMLEEIKFFSLIHKGHTLDPKVITPAEALKAATRNGALSQGREDSGIIREGFKADLIVLKTDEPYMRPIHSLTNNLVYSAVGTDVCLTMANGKVLYKDGLYLTIDIEKVIFSAEQIKERILNELKSL